MRQLSPGVFRVESYQQNVEPRLVRTGHWDLVRPASLMTRPVFGWAEDELVARLISLSREHQQWVAVSWDAFREHAHRDSRLPQVASILAELRVRHTTGDMAEPDLTRFPVHSALEPGQGGMSFLMNGFRRLVEGETRGAVLVHCDGRTPAVSLDPLGLRRILQLQR